MKLYESIKRPDNYSKDKVPFLKGDLIQIQEKVDGSNLSIMKDNNELRLFSRTQEITGDYTNFKGLDNWLENHKNKILEVLKNGNVIFGEWLGQAKIPYNSKAKQDKIQRYYMFDFATSIENMNDEINIKRHYVPLNNAILISFELDIPFVPILVEKVELNKFEDFYEPYVEKQISKIDDESIREGIVIKTIDGLKRTKIVATQFSEVKHKANKLSDSPYQFLDKYITPMRIQKFLMKVQEKENIEEIIPENYKFVFKNLDLLSDDILEEEKDAILKEINKLIKKQSVNQIRYYLSQQQIKSIEVEKDIA